jgi:hypothetical protein
MKGVNELNTWSGGHLMPTASAFGRIIRFISKEYARTKKGVLGVDIGASATTLAAAFAGELFLSVHTRLGLGRNIPGILKSCSIEEISRWLSMDIPEDYVRDYIHNKAIYPASLPGTPEDLDVEQALACQALTTALQQVSSSFPETALRFIPGFLPAFEPIIASGSILTRSPKYGQVLLMLLNAIQPVGVTTLALDQNMVAAALGAIAEVNPLVAVQSLDSGNFINLGTVIAPVGRAEPGTTILRVRIKYNDGSESGLDVKYGALEVAPLPLGQAANLQLQPLHRFDLGMGGGGRGGNVKVIGGMLGLVIDARGRPLELPVEPVKRREFNKKWASALRA